jgi:hypothetical protein
LIEHLPPLSDEACARATVRETEIPINGMFRCIQPGHPGHGRIYLKMTSNDVLRLSSHLDNPNDPNAKRRTPRNAVCIPLVSVVTVYNHEPMQEPDNVPPIHVPDPPEIPF